MACKFCGPKLSLVGVVLSVWGIIQLTLMGVFYAIKAVALLEDLPLGGEHESLSDFISEVETGYTQMVMGIFFKMEVLAFIEEAEPDHHAYEDYDDFMKQTKANYHKIAINCWVAALIYLITLGLSFWCMKHAKEKDSMAEESLQDDEVFCREKQPKRKFKA